MRKFVAITLTASLALPSLAWGETKVAVTPVPSATLTVPTVSRDPLAAPAPRASVSTTFVDPAMIAPLRQGQPAPFPGILFSPRAAASVATELSTAKERTKIEVDAAVSAAEAKKDFVIRENAAACTSDKAKKDAQIDADKKIITDLETRLKKVEDSTPNRTLWFGLGFAAGVGVTILTVVLVNKATSK